MSCVFLLDIAYGCVIFTLCEINTTVREDGQERVMNSEQFRLLGIETDYFAADGSFVRVSDEVLSSLAAILTAPGQHLSTSVHFDEVFTVLPNLTDRKSVV